MLDYFSKPSTSEFVVPVVPAAFQRQQLQVKDFEWYSSSKNISGVQRSIQTAVLKHSGNKFRIGLQDPVQIHVIMFTVFNEYRVFDSIAQFNAIVIDKATQIILNNIYDSIHYRQNIDNVSMRSTNWQTGIIDHPVRPDISDKTLMLTPR